MNFKEAREHRDMLIAIDELTLRIEKLEQTKPKAAPRKRAVKTTGKKQ